MRERSDPIARCEGSLLSYGLSPEEASKSLNNWTGLGVKRIYLPTGLLAEINTEKHPETSFIGVAAFPWGTGTLSSRRMELLECVRLGADAGAVILPRSSIQNPFASKLEAEVTTMISTVPEIDVLFFVDIESLTADDLVRFARVMSGVKPQALIVYSRDPERSCEPETVRVVRGKLHRRIHLVAGGDCKSIREGRELLEAGAESFLATDPEKFLNRKASK